MFEAAILVCLSVSPDTCQQLTDTRGPYPEFEQCEARVAEMIAFTEKANLFELDFKWRCKSVSEKNDESTPPDTQEEGTDSTTGEVLGVAI